MSLSRRILVLSVGSAAAVLVLFTIPLALLLRASAADSVRGSATDSAQAVADYLSSGPSRAATTAYVERVNSRDDSYPVAVVLTDGTVVGADLPGLATVPPETSRVPAESDTDGDGDDGLAPTSSASVVPTDGGQLVVVEVRGELGDDQVVVFAADSRVTTRAAEQLSLLGLVGLVLLALTAVASQVVTRRLVGTLSEAASVADALGEGQLAERVPVDGPPEVQRVALALNRLATRIDELLLAERELVADLSHRLRTPLAALRLDVESLARTVPVPEIEEHLDALERTLTAVIREARRAEREGVRPHADVAAVLHDAFDYWCPLAEDQGRAVSLSVLDGLPPVRSAPEDLRVALDALIGNAVAHTADGVALAVVVAAVPDGGVAVEVRDQGPGVRPDVVLRGRSDRGSSGLGLDIARRCAESSGGGLELDRVTCDGASWAVVRLVLGPA
ncbi:sensor histidine kinase [Nocardioides rubriscoriae]|uniref:sensor histidine kinase n=1 Tax=Nocardioides rubriscoriae TaxID=642762 RepID=UPI0011DF2C1A|nr:HAMP domain-containing sensor histidine kinase [Nocardioides rubriscoriae]